MTAGFFMGDNSMADILNLKQKIKAARMKEQQKYHTQISSGPMNSMLVLDALNKNEDGDALLFIKLNREQVCFDHAEDRWYRWDEQFWREDTTGHVLTCIDPVINLYKQELANQVTAKKTASSKGDTLKEKQAADIIKSLDARISSLHTLKRKKNIIKLAAMGDFSLGLRGDEWDQNPELFVCKNGYIDLRTGNFHNGKPGDFIKAVSETEWKGLDAPAPEWDRFLVDIFNGDTEIISFMQRLFGYIITGLSHEDLLIIFLGDGRNGKTTFLETVSYVSGKYASPIQAETLMSPTFRKSGSDHSADLVAFKGYRLLFSSEIEKDSPLNVARINKLTGGDTISARALRSEMTSFAPTHKLIINTNHKPIIKDPTCAIWERVLLIDFPCRFVADPDNLTDLDRHMLSRQTILKKKHPGLGDKLKLEASGILAWLVKGSLDYFRDGLRIPEKLMLSRHLYKLDDNSIYQFNEACLIAENDARKAIRAGELYQAYLNWCQLSALRPESSTLFGSTMSKLYVKKASNKGNVYQGISLKS
jgi:putative DNA primase/helicase